MTVGEKIQKYRREKGLSQEELGQMLLVSRQTISLWEMDKTLPTIDNLKRLKEIFGVSLDEMLEEKSESAEENPPLEKYIFEYSDEEITHITRLNIRFIISRAIMMLILLGIVYALSIGADYLLGVFTCCVIFVLIMQIRTVYEYFVGKNRNRQSLGNNIYCCEVYGDYFNYSIQSKTGENVSKRKVLFSQISRIWESQKYIFLYCDGSKNQALILRKSDLLQNSFIYTFMYNNSRKVRRFPFQVPLARAYFVAATLSGMAFITWICLATTAYSFDKYRGSLWWLFCVLAIFPIICTALGIIQKKRREGRFVEILFPLILAIALLLYGLASLGGGVPNKRFKAKLEHVVSQEYDSPELIDVFRLKKGWESVDNICIINTKSDGLVVGTFYYSLDDGAMYFKDYGENVHVGCYYLSDAAVSDYTVGFMLFESKDDFPEEYYVYKEITLNEKTFYLCIFYIEYEMVDVI